MVIDSEAIFILVAVIDYMAATLVFRVQTRRIKAGNNGIRFIYLSINAIHLRASRNSPLSMNLVHRIFLGVLHLKK